MSHNVIRTKSKKEGKDRESIQSSINFDMGHHMEKWQSTWKHHTQWSKWVSFFSSRWSQGCKKYTRQYNKDKHETQIAKTDQQKKHPLGMVTKILEDLNMSNGTNFTVNSVCEQRHVNISVAWEITWRRCRLKIFLIYCSGSQLVWQKKNIWAVTWDFHQCGTCDQ